MWGEIMGICWWCHWGWPKPIADVYQKALKKLAYNPVPLHFGPAHIVWEDENFQNCHIQSCFDSFDEYSKDLSEYEKSVVRESLEELLKVPDHFKVEPEGYEEDDNHPEKYPPPEDWVMVEVT